MQWLQVVLMIEECHFVMELSTLHKIKKWLLFITTILVEYGKRYKRFRITVMIERRKVLDKTFLIFIPFRIVLTNYICHFCGTRTEDNKLLPNLEVLHNHQLNQSEISGDPSTSHTSRREWVTCPIRNLHPLIHNYNPKWA